MGAVTRIRKTSESRMAAALTTLKELAAEGRLNGLVFVARLDAGDETIGAFGDYADPEKLAGLAERLSDWSSQAAVRPAASVSIIPLRASSRGRSVKGLNS